MKRLFFLFAVLFLSTSLMAQEKAPDLELPDSDGQIIKLSSLRGKVVLVDFWASWCGYCRDANPGIVEAYKTYKDKKFTCGDGFEIYSVSLDYYKDKWLKAIEDDGLIWSNHVCDYKGWNTEAVKVYGIRGIPNNVLIDAEGTILAKDLSDAGLKKFLASKLAE